MPPQTIALMYHALGDTPGAGVDPHYTISSARFLDQVKLCQRVGQGVVHTRAWLAGAPGVIFTFDDGNESDFTVAFPILAAAHASADFFVTPRQVGTPGYASWAQLREMSENGMSIQSHGLDHSHFLTQLTPAALREELRRARLEIEEKVGAPVTLLAPPGGRNPPRLVETALACGYTHVLNSRPGRVVAGAGATLGRLAVTAGLDSGFLESALRGGPALRSAQVRYWLLALAKRALGDEAYVSLRGRLMGWRRPA